MTFINIVTEAEDYVVAPSSESHMAVTGMELVDVECNRLPDHTWEPLSVPTLETLLHQDMDTLETLGF